MIHTYYKQLSILIIFLFLVACGDNNNSLNSAEENQIVSITTTNVNVSDISFALLPIGKVIFGHLPLMS